MTDRINLDKIAENCIADAIYGMKTFGRASLADAVSDQVGSAVDSCCTYHNACIAIIDDYEREYGADAEDICDGGGEYKASQWQEAMTAYATAICHAALASITSVLFEEIDTAADEVADMACMLANAAVYADDLRISNDCPFGMFAHDREDNHGNLIWESKQCDGGNAIARQVAGIWLSFYWTP